LAPSGCCPLKFLRALENDQGLLTHKIGDRGIGYIGTRATIPLFTHIPSQVS